MELLDDYKLTMALNVQYANLKSKEVWEKKIEESTKFYREIEYQTVKHGIRKCMIHHYVDPSNLHSLSKSLLKDDLIIVPLAKEGADDRYPGFGHESPNYTGNGRYVYRAVIGKDLNDIQEFIDAHKVSDDRRIGELLGYPKCCTEFFYKNWRKGYADPIWQQAENTDETRIKNRRIFTSDTGIDKHLIRISESPEAFKILSVFRYLGTRIVSHIPCSPSCQGSINIANSWLDLGRELGLPGIDETLDILQLPYEWDCLKGIAIVNTPVFKIVAPSVRCFPRYVVQGESSVYPDEAPDGIQFPWRFKGITCN